MSYADRIRAAGGLPDAMLVLAEGIDEVLAALANAPAPSAPDLWAADSWSTPTPGVVVEAARSVDYSEQIAEVEAALMKTSDAGDLQALQAKLRLLKDPGIQPWEMPGGTFADDRTAKESGGTGVVDLPTPDPERERARREWALSVNLGDSLGTGMSNEEAADLYAKGGPMWLYIPRRDVVMGLPDDHRRMMVADVHVDSPKAAYELGRDILKDLDPNTPEVTVDNLIEQIGKNS